jgi:DNA-binding response OmpR family regulator
MKVLVVEDDRKVAGFIEQGLKEEGWTVDVAPDGEEATMLAHVYQYDVILLDVVLPKKNGFQVAAELRREGRNTPILMLTSRDAVEDVVRGLDAGADDYLAKPFSFAELLARVRALGRRATAPAAPRLAVGDLELDEERHVARVGDHAVDLSAREFALMAYLIRNEGRVVSRRQVLDAVWGAEPDVYSNVVDLYVSYCRRKLAELGRAELLRTVRGVGYTLREEA